MILKLQLKIQNQVRVKTNIVKTSKKQFNYPWFKM